MQKLLDEYIIPNVKSNKKDKYIYFQIPYYVLIIFVIIIMSTIGVLVFYYLNQQTCQNQLIYDYPKLNCQQSVSLSSTIIKMAQVNAADLVGTLSKFGFSPSWAISGEYNSNDISTCETINRSIYYMYASQDSRFGWVYYIGIQWDIANVLYEIIGSGPGKCFYLDVTDEWRWNGTQFIINRYFNSSQDCGAISLLAVTISGLSDMKFPDFKDYLRISCLTHFKTMQYQNCNVCSSLDQWTKLLLIILGMLQSSKIIWGIFGMVARKMNENNKAKYAPELLDDNSLDDVVVHD
jgi:hypothetical protein